MTQAHEAIEAFEPDVILYRPLVDRPSLHELAMTTLRCRTDLPLVTWIMDDWPARLATVEPQNFASANMDLLWLLRRSGLRLAISDAMSEAFLARYGMVFTAIANGVDPVDWTAPRQHSDGSLVIRYSGGIAADMNADSLVRVARAVQARADAGQDVRFEIATTPHWAVQSGALFDGLSAIEIETVSRPRSEYVRWLSEADVLVVAYNFDPDSLRYVRYSMANKMPECMAAGAALLAHGPRGVATVDYLADADVAEVVDTDDIKTALEAAVERLGRSRSPSHVGQRGPDPGLRAPAIPRNSRRH